MAIKLTSFSEEGLVQFLQSHQESELSLKVNLQSNQDISYLKIIEDQFSSLIHLTEFSIKIPHYCVLAQRGYTHISNAIQNLKQLTKLSIKIYGFIQDQEIILLKNSIQTLANLETLSFKVYLSNDISSLIGQELVDSLSILSNLRKLTFTFSGIKKCQIDDSNIHFWRGIQSLQNLEKLALEIKESDYGQQDLRELFSHITNLRMLKSFSFNSIKGYQPVEFIDMIISYLGQMVNLQSLKIEFGNSEVYFSETQRKEILKSLSHLKYLEKFKINTIQRQLIKHDLKEYVDLIGGLKYLKKLNIECYDQKIQEPKVLNELSQSFLNLTNMTHFELTISPFFEYDEFIQNLSISLENMKNLHTLKLNVGELNYLQCTQLSISLNKLHNLSSLQIKVRHYFAEKTSFLIQKLEGGFINLKDLTFDVEIFFENNLNTFLPKLINLETLKISNINFRLNSDFEEFYQAFRNLKQLKKLDIGLRIEKLKDQAHVQILESTFKELQLLESMKIQLGIENKSRTITKLNILEHLKNLKKLSLNFAQQVVNIFDLSPSSLTKSYNLEEIEYLSSYNRNFWYMGTLLEVMNSFSNNFPKVKKLELSIFLSDSSIYTKQFSEICSKLTNLTNLILLDRGQNAMSFYAKGIKQLKGLNKLKMEFQYQEKEEDVRQLGKALQKLENLQQIQLLTKLNKTDIVKFENELSKVLQNHKKLRTILISPNEYDGPYQCLFYTVQLSSQINENENHKLQVQNEKIIDENERVEQQKSSEKTESKLLKQLPYQFKINIIQEGGKCAEHLSLINNFDHIGMQYLLDLKINSNILDSDEECQYEFLVKDFTIQFNQLNRLRYLTLDLFKLSFNEEQILYFSQNIKHLINLRHLTISIDRIDDNYCSFFEELIHLKELRTLRLETKISDRALNSLGNSLKELINLEVCTLKFDSQSKFGIQGLLSLLNGLKGLTNMQKLILHLNSLGLKNQNSQENNELVLDFFEKMKKLYVFEFKLSMNQKEIKVLDLYSSLIQLQFLEILTINLSSNHSLNQEMLDQLINSINLLTHLRTISILIHFDSNDKNNKNEMKIPKQLSNYFNRQSLQPLEIRVDDQSIELFQRNMISFTFYSECITNTKLEFMEDLNKNKIIIIKFDSSESQLFTIFHQMESCRTKEIKLKQIHIQIENDANYFCSFVQKIPHTSILQIKMQIELSILDDLFYQIANSINQLKNLRALNLKITTNNVDNGGFYDYIALSDKHLLQIVSILQNQKNLYKLKMNYNSGKNNSKLKNSVKKKLKKLVIYDFYCLDLFFNDD